MERFLADENVPRPSIRLLRDAGHNVAAVREDQPGSEDDDVLARARREDRVLLTFDRDHGD
jgi:predicted nuclease of predicted toxin-antitoxin system